MTIPMTPLIKTYQNYENKTVVIEGSAVGNQDTDLLRAYEGNSDLIIIEDNSREIRIFNNIHFSRFIDENNNQYGANVTDTINELNAMFMTTGTSTGNAPVITSSLTVNSTQGDTINYELTANYGVGYEWSGLPSGLTPTDGNIRHLIGGSHLTPGTYPVTAKAINYYDDDSQTINFVVGSWPYANTKAVRFNNNDYIGATALNSNPLYRSSNGTGASDAWSIAGWFKGGTNSNAEQTILSFGGADRNNEGHAWLYWNNSGGDKRIVLEYGTSNNRLLLKTPPNSFIQGVYRHVLVTYDGGTTGSASGSINSYYGRFKIYINGVLQTLTTSHNNYGFSGEIKSEAFRVGQASFGGKHLRNNCLVDELALWDSDQSSNAADIYNAGAPHDLSLLTSPPVNYWRMGDGDTYPTIQDSIGTLDFTMYSMTAADIVNDVP